MPIKVSVTITNGATLSPVRLGGVPLRFAGGWGLSAGGEGLLQGVEEVFSRLSAGVELGVGVIAPQQRMKVQV